MNERLYRALQILRVELFQDLARHTLGVDELQTIVGDLMEAIERIRAEIKARKDPAGIVSVGREELSEEAWLQQYDEAKLAHEQRARLEHVKEAKLKRQQEAKLERYKEARQSKSKSKTKRAAGQRGVR